jgi:galactofuranose transport system substrate-binding protein
VTEVRARLKRPIAALAIVVGVAVPFAACGGAEELNSSEGGSTKSASKETIDKFLLAPADAESFDAEPSEQVTAPTSGGKMSLPYKHVLPLPDGPVGDPNKTYEICMSQALTGSTWAVAQADSVRLEAKRHPNVKVSYYNTNNDPLKQVADLDTCLARKVDGILVWPHSVEPLTPEIEKIQNSGTVVVGMERTVATRNYTNWIYLDNAKATADLADEVGKHLNGKGTVAETDGATGSSPQILRRAGFVEALKEKYPDIKVVFTSPTDYSRGQGYKVALDFLQSGKGKDIDAWYTQYTEIGIGVDRALKDANRQIPQFSIVDGKVAVERVQDGTFTAIAPWSPLHGDVALRAALYNLTGKEAPKNISLTQPPAITEENAAEALQQTWPG